jgi:hypothetical protein
MWLSKLVDPTHAVRVLLFLTEADSKASAPGPVSTRESVREIPIFDSRRSLKTAAVPAILHGRPTSSIVGGDLSGILLIMKHIKDVSFGVVEIAAHEAASQVAFFAR